MTGTATVIIVTHNRCDDVVRAVKSTLAQSNGPLEVIVFDDASTDGTCEKLRSLFPNIKLNRSEQRVGYIVLRNQGFRQATGDIVFSIDDDAYFADRDTIAATMMQFSRDEQVGAVAIPYIEPFSRRSVSSLNTRASLTPLQELRNYVGCAHAIRRDVALRLGGYREYFVHQGEERDLCIRLREAGWKIIYGGSGHIVHTVSPSRERDRVNYYGARNQILFNWLNVPFSAMMIRMFWDSWAIMRYRFCWSMVPRKSQAIAAGYLEAFRRFGDRSPVSWRVYRTYRRLAAHGPEDWNDEALPEPL